jgi:hypothetical protein
VRAKRGPAILGVIVGAAGVALSATLDPRRRLELGALELAFIAGSYPAMSLHHRSRTRATELAAGGAFLGCAFLGLTHSSRATIATGLLAHGAWDLAHHRNEVGTRAPDGYPIFCLVADCALAVPLLAPVPPPRRFV